MRKEIKLANDLIDFIYDSPTAFHAVENTMKLLNENDFKELDNRERWELNKGGKYYIVKNNSALIAFTIGNEEIEETGFRLIGTHTDAPTFRIKPNPEMKGEGGYLKLNTEVYGGPILSTWFDRPLAMAGRVALRSEDILYPEIRLVNINKPLLIIPNIAIHFNRKVNEGVPINKQKDTLPIIGMIHEELEKEGYVLKLLSEELGIKEKDIIDFDLFLYEYDKGRIMGANDAFISSPRLDDLAMVHGALKAITSVNGSKATNVMVCFDNEEIGSNTKQGAASPMLRTVLERITLAMGKDKEDFYRGLYRSFIISADMAHAVHPNAPEKHDPINKPSINKGPVIKINANQNYTTDCESSSIYEMICQKEDIPVQKLVNRSDQRGGSTIGPIASHHIDIRSIDIGSPLLAMHAIRELGGVMDHYYMTQSFKAFYSL